MDCSTPGLSVPHHLPKFAQVHVHCILDAIQPSHPLTPFSPSAPAAWTFPMSPMFTSDDQNTGVSTSASVFPMNIRGWFPLRLTWFNLLAVQGALRSLLQHHSSKVSILQCWAFFMVQLSYPYMTTGKTIALTIKVRKWVIFLLINCPLKPVTSFWGVQRHQFFSALPSLQSSSHNLSLLDWQKQKNCQASE